MRLIVGPTDELVYPFGADISGLAEYRAGNDKFAFLHRTEGFDGFTMQRELDGHHTPLSNFFTTKGTINPERPLPLVK